MMGCAGREIPGKGGSRMKTREHVFTTYVDVDGVERYPVQAYYEVEPAEPDVNFPGGIEINSVMYKKDDISTSIASEDWDDLVIRVEEYENDRGQAALEDAADSRYDAMREEKLWDR
jgi:hypothetical protein